MRARRSQWRAPSPTYTALGITGVATLCIVWLAWVAPLTFDEAYNRLHYGTLGSVRILRDYDRPNNHFVFTVIQSWLPVRMLRWEPWTIRVASVVIGSLLVLVVLLVAARCGSLLIACCLIAGAPLLVTYLFVARGYGFSSLLIVVSVLVPFALARRAGRRAGLILAALVLAVGIWPLPTNVLLVPGWLLGAGLLYGVADALPAGAVVVAAVAAEYIPAEAGLRKASHTAWNGHPGVWPYVRNVVDGASMIPVCLVAASVLVAVAFARANRFRSLADLRHAERRAQLAIWCVLAAASWFAGILLTDAAGTPLPFTRNALPALWLLVLALVAAAPRGRLNRLVALILAAPFVLGVLLWAQAGRNADWKPVADASRNDILYRTTPATIRDAGSIHATAVECEWWDWPVCVLVTPKLFRQGIRVNLIRNRYVAGLPCALGSRRPPSPWQVIVVRGNQLLGQLCH